MSQPPNFSTTLYHFNLRMIFAYLLHLHHPPPATKARDSFGRSVAISGTTTFIGANGDDAMTQNAGAAYTVDVGIQRVYFRSAEYYGTEGTGKSHVVSVRHRPRRPRHYTRPARPASSALAAPLTPPTLLPLPDSIVTIYIDRDEDYADEALTVAYATSDLTAKGVDSKK